MKKVLIGRFVCAGCKAKVDLELAHEDDMPLPDGWCQLNGWWKEGPMPEAVSAEGRAKADGTNIPLNIYACSYGCMGKFFVENLLEGLYTLCDNGKAISGTNANTQIARGE